jgi:hypothetical protein
VELGTAAASAISSFSSSVISVPTALTLTPVDAYAYGTTDETANRDTRVQLQGTANTGSFYITNNTLGSPAAERCARLAAWALCNHVRSRRRGLPVALLHVLRTRSTDSGDWWFEGQALLKEGAQVKRGLPARKTADRPERHRRPIAAEHGDHLSVLADSARFVIGIAIYDKMRFASQK